LPFCDWQPRWTKYGAQFWQCSSCCRKTLHPTSIRAQARAGTRCPGARARESASAAD
jgi:hypothetical protein